MKSFAVILGTFLSVFVSQFAFAQAQILNGNTLAPTQIEDALARVKPGSIVVLGEQHGTVPQPLFQVQVMETIRKMGMHVSVGMEFLNYPYQSLVDQYRAGTLAEPDFLKQIKWNGFPYDSYRQQILFPKVGDGTTIALNAPAALTSKVAKTGLASLTPDEAAWLPPQFQKGNDLYLERFKEVMGSHLPTPDALDRYFTAQSIWDDSMAWKATDFIKANPDQVLVIVVGEFHVQYGGGLPDRIKARGVSDVTTFSLVNLQGMTDAEVQTELAPSTKYGDRANFIWAGKY